MSVRYILGRSGAGKTHYCMEDITAKAQNKQDHPLILLVPEQFTLQSQKDLITRQPQKGIMRAEVLSFQRLAYRVFGEVGGTTKKVLGDIGKTMVLRKIIHGLDKELKVFQKAVRQKGFMDSLGQTIEEFHQYAVEPAHLKDRIELAQGKPGLQHKLHDLYLIYSQFTAFIQKEYITTEETLDLLAQKVEQSKYLEGAEIWIDGFYGFTPQEYRILYKLSKKVKRLNITLTVDPDQYRKVPLCETDPFYESKRTIHKLDKITALYDVDVEEPICLKGNPTYRFIDNSDLAHLEQMYFQYPCKEYGASPDSMRIFTASNRYTEIEYISRCIIELVRDHQWRFRDIAVVSGGLMEYEKNIKGIFKEYEIPYFIDQKSDILSHPLIELVRAGVEILIRNWSYESLFRYLKTNLTEIPREEVDILENYALAYGIRGISTWTGKDWTFGIEADLDTPRHTEYEEQQQNKVNDIRKKVIRPLKKMHTSLKKSTLTVKSITEALYELLQDLHVSDTLSHWIDQYRQEQKLLLVKKNTQIWDLLMDVLDKMVEILGDEKVTLEEYARILDSGFMQCTMGLIPPALDQVVVGDLQRSRLHEIKALFVIGVNDGIVPSPVEELGLFSDMERVYMNGLGIELAPDGRRKVFEEQFQIYMGLTKPSQKLSLSYALGDEEGKALRPSVLVSRIKKLFPYIQEDSDLHLQEEQSLQYVTRPSTTFHHLGNALRQHIEQEEVLPLWWDVLSWYKQNSLWQHKLDITIKGLFHTNQEQYLQHTSVKKLYGREIYSSVSKLEKFMGCPFAYFAQYGLKAKERKLFRLHTPDLGRLFHKALDEFAKKLEAEQIPWRKLTKSECDHAVGDIIENLAPRLGNEILLSTARYSYLVERLKRITRRAVWTLTEHIKRGTFEPLGFEVGFGKDEKLPPIVIELPSGEKIILTGRVDRIDILDQDQQAYIKIIDYKSGSKTFNLLDIYYGLQLQLLLYLDAFLENSQAMLGKELLPGGIFYFKIDDPMLTSAKAMEEEEIEALLLKKLKLSGLVLADVDLVKNLDKDIQTYSEILPVQLTKDGGFAKNSSVATLEEFDQLRHYVRGIVKEIGKEIMEGNIKISPYKSKDGKACEYCLYGSICQFDPLLRDNQYRTLKPLKKEEVWAKLKEKNESQQ